MNPILLLHGALGCEGQLYPLAELLKAQGRTVYSLNFSGHGGAAFSDKAFGIEAFARDVVSFLAQKDIQQVDVFGYSMGGYVALWCCYMQPQQFGRVITLGTKFDWDPFSAEREIKKMNPEKVEEKIPAFARLLEKRHAPIDWKLLMQETAAMMNALGKSPLLTEAIFKSIRQSALLLLGDQDDMADADYTQRVSDWMPHAKFEWMRDTPHPIERVRLMELVEKIVSNT